MRLISLFLLVSLLFSSNAWGIDRLNCSVTLHEFNFGTYRSTSSTPTYAKSTLEVTCIQPVIVNVKLDAGENAGINNFHDRVLRSGTNTLKYNLYVDAACTKVWGDGTNNTYTASGQNQIIIYGKIPRWQEVSPGLYTDYITVTLEW